MKVTGLIEIEALDHRRGAFKGQDDEGRTWFAKPPYRDAPGRFKFAEVIMAAMARSFGLRWPETIPHQFDAGPGVLVSWVDGLRPLVPESGEIPSCWDWALAQHQNLQQLAGFAVLSRWADRRQQKRCAAN